MFNEDDEKRPPSSVLELKKRVRSADALLIVTPEYNYSIPGVLKNAIDWACRPYGDSAWSGKAAAIMGASLGAIGTARAQCRDNLSLAGHLFKPADFDDTKVYPTLIVGGAVTMVEEQAPDNYAGLK